uniref:Uncharacterized protein n=1 Tax=Panagrolaimus sp. PS1159 TaxID=55785 RepID=A0AC35FJZ1_9BILA
MNVTSPPSKSFFLLHMNFVMAMAIAGNLFLVFVICRGSRVTKHKISPVQVSFLKSVKMIFIIAQFTIQKKTTIH